MNYREEMLRTLVGFENKRSLLHAMLGIAAESGEVVDVFKKHWRDGTPLNKDAMIKELGDLRWYLELACDQLGVTLVEVEQVNIDKLRKRYPKGFTTDGGVR
jgi:NTP pyrophosphatase (non-canonical NTP hydrolase)